MASAKSTGAGLGDQDLRRRNVIGAVDGNGRIPDSVDQVDNKKTLQKVQYF